MDHASLEALKQRLEVERNVLKDRLREIGVENPAVPGDFEPTIPNYGDEHDDSVNESTDLDVNIAVVSELERRFKEVQAALEKIEHGTYGACATCATSIAADRLQAVPTAALCTVCAQKR
ncbi:MAG: TraR/DksA C4-type zinc finger protein [Patescibacteria group bacterium]